ncbi:bifunctional ADP-dependent NAD(P)H-hydrate dehydratase/NAD(P)H-hydrate epimerase [Xanthomonas massiliensis]|uniref:bifunctional ADP-dependent NAD(P)H-hydrate dehydratase/NAD(P)H-hydrate epimerase n=1 Tax=Xanthomonas massiliensis TaxID=1720302 RepID=UPI0008256643|nr:bifunctional ADP-dependent NAD(P)H-hydrate dehydratase/NAD(P)H-hydrate epimerase [Xanthomonas massiliensis]
MYTPLDLYDVASARSIDVRATAQLGGDAYVLMQRAGLAVWQQLARHWPQARRIVVACGTGNNGGDGYVLARLAHQAGRDVTVVHLPGHGPASALAQRACTDYLGAGGRVALFPSDLADADVLVDALFGIGLNRAPDAPTAAFIEAINAAAAPVLAIDVPSGVDAGRGCVPGTAVRAQLTVQCIVAHVGLYTGDALEHVGHAEVVGLDVPPSALEGLVPAAQRWTAEALGHYLHPRRLNTHKGESGHVLCVGGNLGSGGAIIMSTESALRSGAGLVSVATRQAHVAPLLTLRPEAMTRAVEDADTLRPLLEKASVIAIGPGLGQDAWAQMAWPLALEAGKALVLDADALNLLAAHPRPLPADTVLTPHPGEAGRLLGLSSAQVQGDRLAAAHALVERYGVTAILKGAGSVVVSPGQVPRIIAAGNPGMAVGGMGDLLTGVVAALRGQKLAPFDAAAVGALLHAAAGDAAAADGERGLLPLDLLPHLRRLANPEPQA